jgi:iron complex transport system substrate-binding protein
MGHHSPQKAMVCATSATNSTQYFNRPGPRVADTIEILREVLDNGSGPVRYEGCGWKKMAA